MRLIAQFQQDDQGRRFTDVMNDTRIDFDKVCQFFECKARQQRMIDSEEHHDRPALAGVIKEFESQSHIKNFFEINDGHSTTRFRQSIGVIVKIIMQNNGWCTTGRKGSLGKRVRVPAGTTSPGAYRNDTTVTNNGLSIWFTRAERYQRHDSVQDN